ncbi:M1 family metallopeptidase [Psychroserpens sp. SPM9]|uniref:M1 family metallopeptidase n=1 Tax=Psychroserpens sp. SPM9 TaxID=2975598 RepID=UPI0021A570D7|nr:M1 family metallopeptidase [Psychroserpens sp. SPM9]MDG5491242.1 M1 family metallopeptidase [Psychroserpens sp. SPM9]
MNRLFQLFFILIFCGSITAQQTDYVDFLSVKADVRFDFETKRVSASVDYKFKILKETDSIYLDVRDNIDHYELHDSNFKLRDNLNGNRLVFNYTNELVRDSIYEFKLIYFLYPKKALYFIDDQIWTQGQGKYTSNWLPSIDDVNDKIEFDISISYKNGYEVLANGKLVDKEIGDTYTTWHYNMQKPMSSYLVALAIGNYDKKTEVSKSGIPLEYYYYPEDSLKVEPTYRYTKQMFDFLEEEIGVSYPWQNYKQVPVKDFLYSGMENTSLTIFSDSFVVDSTAYNDRNYITVNAHELAHQWFGDLVTATSGEHHWLQEGFATYYALLAERAIFGDDHYYWQLFENAQELIAQDAAGQSTSLLNPKSSSTTFYKKGAWALHILREKVGDTAFKSAVKAYLEKHQFANVETTDFIAEVEQASGLDLTEFVNEWLVSKALPEDAMVKSLKQSSFMQEYFMVDCEAYSSKCETYLSSYISDKAKVKVISQISDKIKADAFQNGLKVRQAIARYVDEIPVELKSDYETLLNDKSYNTIEAALYNLWVNFPQERVRYLQKTKDIKGFNDYNVRLLWLALHLNTLEFQPEKKQEVLQEVIGYSLPGQHFELRMNAFNYLKLLGGFEVKSIESLLEAQTHHNWRFSKYAKNLISELEQNATYKNIINKLKEK